MQIRSLKVAKPNFSYTARSKARASLNDFVRSNNRFALKFLPDAHMGSNMFYSGFALRSNLLSILPAARGNTRTEILRTVELSEQVEDANHSLQNLVLRRAISDSVGRIQEMTSGSQPINPHFIRAVDRPVRANLELRQGIWSADAIQYSDGYLEVLQRYFGDILSRVKIPDDLEACRQEINQALSRFGAYEVDHLPEGVLEASAHPIILGSTFLIELPFKQPFSVNDLRTARFGEEASASNPLFLYGRRELPFWQGRFPSTCTIPGDNHFEAVSLPYLNDEFAQIIIRARDPDQMLRSLADPHERFFERLLENLKPRKIDLALPRIVATTPTFNEFCWEQNISRQEKTYNLLFRHGLLDAFSKRKADFSGFSQVPNSKKPCILNVFQSGTWRNLEMGHQGFIRPSGRIRNLDARDSRDTTRFYVTESYVSLLMHVPTQAILATLRVEQPNEFLPN